MYHEVGKPGDSSLYGDVAEVGGLARAIQAQSTRKWLPYCRFPGKACGESGGRPRS